MFGWKLGVLEVFLLIGAVIAIAVVVFIVAAPTKWVHRMTGDRRDEIEPHSHTSRD